MQVYLLNMHKYSAGYDVTLYKQPFTVLVEGNIGAGKSTFVKRFENHPDITVMREPVEEWRNMNGHNLLQLMYEDRDRWFLAFQSYVMLTMSQLHEAHIKTPIKLMERSLYSAQHVFVEHTRQNGSGLTVELNVLAKWFEELNKKQATPELIIYLRTSPHVVHERILRRGRNEERHIPISYIQELHELHDKWLLGGECKSEVVVVDADASQDTLTTNMEYIKQKILNRVLNIKL